MNLPVPVNSVQYQTLAPAPQYSSQCSLNAASQSQTNNLVLILLFLVTGVFCLGCWSRKQYKQQIATCRHQQIELLEKIWKMTAQQDS